MKKETLCWSCQNYAKCSWATKKIPVENWEATPTRFKDVLGNKLENGEYSSTIIVDSFCVHKCPQYLADKIQVSSQKEIAKIVGVHWRSLYRAFQDSEKSKQILNTLKEKGYKLRVYDEDNYYYLEKLSNESQDQ